MDPRGAPNGGNKFIVVQVPKSEIFGEEQAVEQIDNGPITGLEKKPNWFKRQLSQSIAKKEPTVGIIMRWVEFYQYFAKDKSTGKYRDEVVEPPGGRQQWLQQRLHDQNTGQLEKEDPEDDSKPESGTSAPPTTKGERFVGAMKGFGRTAIDTYAKQQGVGSATDARQTLLWN